MVRQRRQDFRRGKWNVQEKPDPIATPAAAQRVRDRYQVVVMGPDQIIVLDDLFKLGREVIIDLEISTEISACELGEVQSIMQDWPQHSIGKAPVIFVKTLLRKVGDHISDVPVSDEARFGLAHRCDLAAPAKPDAPGVIEHRPQRYFESASARGTVARNRHAVRNDYEPCQ